MHNRGRHSSSQRKSCRGLEQGRARGPTLSSGTGTKARLRTSCSQASRAKRPASSALLALAIVLRKARSECAASELFSVNHLPFVTASKIKAVSLL